MRILMLNWRCPSNPKSGGAEYVTRKHLEAWALAGHEVHWLAGGYPGAKTYEKLSISPKTIEQCKGVIPDLPAPLRGDPGSISPPSTLNNVTSSPVEKSQLGSQFIHLHRFGSPLTISFLAPLLYWCKWHGDFDLVIDQIHGIPFLAPLWAWKSRKIAFIHEVAQEIWDEMFPWPVNIIGKFYERLYFLLYRHVAFWVDSKSTRDDLVRYGIKTSLIHVIPCAIDLEPVTGVPEKEKTLTFIFLARLVKMKGIEEALRIIAEIKKTTPEVKLWVVGGGDPDYVSHLKSMTKELGIEPNVEFKGRVDDDEKVQLLRRAHWLLHTSMREGFGLTVLEANSQGTPVIAYDVHGLKDLIQPNTNGLLMLAQTTDPDKRIIHFPQDSEYLEICQTALKASRTYQWDVNIKRSLALIESL
ncbi:MAG: glycosyltransferase family 4 protein [Candidatus Roizmanbacteria bacterium]